MQSINYLNDMTVPIFRYELLIAPANWKVNEIGNMFYHDKKIVQSKVQVTLLHFLHRETMEFRLINCLEKFVRDLDPISISLANNKMIDSKKEAFENPIANLMKHMRFRFQRILNISPLLKPFFISYEEIIKHFLLTSQFKLSSKKISDLIYIDELILVKYKVDPFTLDAIGKPKIVRHFLFRGQQRYQINNLVNLKSQIS